MNNLHPYKVLSQKTVINEPYCHIEKQKVQFPNGEEGDWFIKHNDDAVIVLPILTDGRVMLQKSYKHGSGVIVSECVAGMVDDGESPEVAAERELLEESGYKAKSLKKLGVTFANPTSSPMKYHFYLAEGCRKVAEQDLEAAEQIDLFFVEDLEEAKKLIDFALTIKGIDKAVLYVKKAVFFEIKKEYKKALKELKLAKEYCYNNDFMAGINSEKERIKGKLPKEKKNSKSKGKNQKKKG